MSKVMVILDEPTCCGYCKLSGGFDSYCRVTLGALERDKYKCRPEWCPLKPLPDKKPNLKAYPSSLNDASWNAGYNHCINDIFEGINE